MRLWGSSVCAACARLTPALLVFCILSAVRVGQVFVTLQCLVHCRDRPLYPCDPPTALWGPPQAPTLRASWALPGSGLLSFGSARMVSYPRPASVMLLQATSLNPVTPTAHEPQQHTVMSFWSESRNSKRVPGGGALGGEEGLGLW